jgi:hypothetical protein
LNCASLTRFGPAPVAEGTPRLDWTERVVREHVLPELKPLVLIDWLTEPDGAQHAHGVGSTAARAALGNSDRNLAAFLDAAARLGLTDRLHVIVTSDHGFARHGEAFSIAGALVTAGIKQTKDSDDVVVVSNSQSAALHVKGHDRATNGYEGFVQVSGTGTSWYVDKGWSVRTTPPR